MKPTRQCCGHHPMGSTILRWCAVASEGISMAPAANDWGLHHWLWPQGPSASSDPRPLPIRQAFLHIHVPPWGQSELMDLLIPHTNPRTVLLRSSLQTILSTMGGSCFLPLWTWCYAEWGHLRQTYSLPKLDPQGRSCIPSNTFGSFYGPRGFNLKERARTLLSEPLHLLHALLSSDWKRFAPSLEWESQVITCFL